MLYGIQNLSYSLTSLSLRYRWLWSALLLSLAILLAFISPSLVFADGGTGMDNCPGC